MESLLILLALGGIAYLLVKQKPEAPAQADGLERDSTVASVPMAARASSDWVRQAIIFVASVAVAFIVVSSALSILLGVTSTLGAMVGVSGKWVMLLLLGGLAFYVHRTKSAPKIKAYVAAKWTGLKSKVQAPLSVSAQAAAPREGPDLSRGAAAPVPEGAGAQEQAPSIPSTPLPDVEPEAAAVEAPAPVIRTDPAPVITAPAPRNAGRQRNWIVAGAAVAAAGGLVFAGFVLNPAAFDAAVGWMKGASGVGGHNSASQDGGDVQSGSAAPSVEEIAIDEVLESFVTSASTARAAREAIANDLNPALAAAELSSDADKIRALIADQEKVIADARRSALDSAGLVAEALTVDPALVEQAVGIVRDSPAIRQNPLGAELLSVLTANRAGASDPGKFSTAAIAAWDRASMMPVVVASADNEVPEAAGGEAADMVAAANVSGPSTATSPENGGGARTSIGATASAPRPNAAPASPQRPSGNAYDRRPESRERREQPYPGIGRVSPEDLQRVR